MSSEPNLDRIVHPVASMNDDQILQRMKVDTDEDELDPKTKEENRKHRQ